MRNPIRIALGLLSLVLVCSVIFNVIQYRNKQAMGKELLNSGLQQTFVYLNDASEDIANNKIQDANTFLSWSVGGLLVIRQPLTHYGVGNLTGIMGELQKAQSILSNPQNYSSSQVKSMKNFVSATANYFKKCIVNNQVSIVKLKAEIRQIYSVIPQNDRAQFENSGP